MELIFHKSWLTYPNKNELTPEHLSYSANYSLNSGQISCTIKHYMALKDIVENGHELAVIMEDNVAFKSNVPGRIQKYLNQLPFDWGILFDSDWKAFSESPTTPDTLVYLKSNEITAECHGGSRLANFILIKLETAKKLLSSYLPFTHVSDWYYNDLLRQYSLKSYWSEPGNTYHVNRPSTC